MSYLQEIFLTPPKIEIHLLPVLSLSPITVNVTLLLPNTDKRREVRYSLIASIATVIVVFSHCCIIVVVVACVIDYHVREVRDMKCLEIGFDNEGTSLQ